LINCAAYRHVPTRGPVLCLESVAAVPGGLAPRADLELLPEELNLAPLVMIIRTPTPLPPPNRGFHSFTSQLNLSLVCHTRTPYTP